MNKLNPSLANTKLYSQAFACLCFAKHNCSVDINLRRRNLKIWFSDKPIPEKEKSYISQLINGKASFGEKAARRLEKTYGMPEKYLDNEDINIGGIVKQPIYEESLLKYLTVDQLALVMKFASKVSTMGTDALQATDKIVDGTIDALKAGRRAKKDKGK